MDNENKKRWIGRIKKAMEMRGSRTSTELASVARYSSASIWAAFTPAKRVSRLLNQRLCDVLQLDESAMWRLLTEGIEPAPGDSHVDRAIQLIRQMNPNDLPHATYFLECIHLARQFDEIRRLATSAHPPRD